MEQNNQTPNQPQTMRLNLKRKVKLDYEVESTYGHYINAGTNYPYAVLLTSRDLDEAKINTYVFVYKTWEEAYQTYKHYCEDKAKVVSHFASKHEYEIIFFNAQDLEISMYTKVSNF